MNKWIIAGLLMVAVSLAAFGQFYGTTDAEDGPKLTLTGGFSGTFTVGFLDEDQRVMMSPGEGDGDGGPAPGIYYGEETDKTHLGKIGPGMNGYSVSMNFSMLYSPVPYTEVFIKLLAQYRPGSPYIPLQLEDSDKKTFSNFSMDNAWGRVDAIQGLGFDLPLEVWLKMGKYDAAPAQFQKVTRYGTEAVMTSLRTTNDYNMQLEAVYHLPMIKALSLGLTTHMKLKEALPVLLNDDEEIGNTTFYHGDPKSVADIPFQVALKMEEFDLPFGKLSAELIYAYNAMLVYSGNNFGANVGLNLPIMDNLSIPVGLGFVLYGQNIDPFSDTSIITEKKYNSLYYMNGYHTDITQNWDSMTTSYRAALRIGVGTGARYNITDDIYTELHVGFALSQIAHYYRETLTLPALSADLRGSFQDRYFIGGGIFLGTLIDAAWTTNEDIDASLDDSSHSFTLAENMGFEVYGGIQMGKKARFVLGYNINKGLSMNNSIESVPDGQIKYRQKDTLPADGLFERGGFFGKLATSW